MTFKEYINQKDPKRAVNVEIYNDDCYQIIPINTKQCRAIIRLEIVNKLWDYHLSEQDNLLRTMDEDGNPKSVSCFIWKGKIERGV